jgi:CheY-like chemotaxis protein
MRQSGESTGTVGQSGQRAAPPPHAPRVLLAEDDEDFRTLLTRRLADAGYFVVEAEDGDAMLDLLVDASSLDADRALTYHAIITDVVMPGFSGIDVLRAFRRSTASAALIVMSAFNDARIAQAARALGAAAFLLKPFDTEELVRTLDGSLNPSSELIRLRSPRRPPTQS